MAAVENDDLSGLSDRSLGSRIKQGRKDFRKLEKRPRTREVIEEMQKQVDLVTVAEKELRTRQYGSFAEQLPRYRARQRARWRKVESRDINDSLLVWLGIAALVVVLIVVFGVFFDALGTHEPPAFIAGSIR